MKVDLETLKAWHSAITYLECQGFWGLAKAMKSIFEKALKEGVL